MKGVLAQAAVAVAAIAAFVALLQLLRGLAAWVRGDAAQAPMRPAEDVVARDEQRRRVLQHLREIEFDRATGKLDDADYRALRTRYEAEALRLLDATGSSHSAEGTP